MRTPNLLLLSFAISAGSATAQDGKPQLLPGSVQNGVQVQWRQDGRVLEYTARNPVATWVITELKLVVDFQPPTPPPAAQPAKPAEKPKQKKNGANSSALDVLVESGIRFTEDPEIHVARITVLPSREVTSRIELKSESRVIGVRVVEARGREPTVMENMRNMVR